MVEHPCAGGLTGSCFRAYPKWARQAFAYKILHTLVPKQLTKLLPKMLTGPLVAPGVTLPPGFDLPPGTTIPPGFEIPSGMSYESFMSMYFRFFLPDWITYLEKGTLPPSLVEVFGPGPPSGIAGKISPPFDIGDLLYEHGVSQTTIDFGESTAHKKLGTMKVIGAERRIHGVKLKIGKIGSPIDYVYLELREMIIELQRAPLITGGVSLPVPSSSFGSFGTGQDYNLFIFPDKPLVTAGLNLLVVLCRTGDPDASNYYQSGKQTADGYLCWYNDGGVTWSGSFYETLDLKVYGKLT